VEFFNLRANTILRKRIFDLTSHVAIDIAKPVDNKNQQNQGNEADRGGNRRDEDITLVKETSASALGSYRWGLSASRLAIASATGAVVHQSLTAGIVMDFSSLDGAEESLLDELPGPLSRSSTLITSGCPWPVIAA